MYPPLRYSIKYGYDTESLTFLITKRSSDQFES